MNQKTDDTRTAWHAQCVACPATIALPPNGNPQCPECKRSYTPQAGIYEFLDAAAESHYERFLHDYTLIRHAEQRAYDAQTLQALPSCPADHPLASQWHIRAQSFGALMKELRGLARNAKVLDLGAGVGWLCGRLHSAGYLPCAVDLSADDIDGLGAAAALRPDWPRIRASFESLPLADDQADVVIFNGSFHYTENAPLALAEALRIMRSDGRLIILDTPVYRSRESGERMTAELHEDFERRFGTRSDSLQSIGFLTWFTLRKFGENAGLDWRIVKPWYGLRWALRKPLARLRGQREPATFALLIGRRRIVEH